MANDVAKSIPARITEQILAKLDNGVVPWERPWDPAVGRPANAVTGKPYRGANIFILSAHADYYGCESPLWATPKQINDLGGSIRRGAKVAWVHFWNLWTPKPKDEDDEPEARWIVKAFRAINLSQTVGLEGYEAPAHKGAAHIAREHTPIAKAEAIVAGYKGKPPIRTSSDGRAFYNYMSDYVSIPPANAFRDSEHYYSVLFHELTHSTGHPDRLARKSIVEAAPFGTPHYGREELIAEMGAAMLSAVAGIEHATLNTSAGYLNSWREKIGEDKRAIVTAGAQAQKAVDLILGD